MADAESDRLARLEASLQYVKEKIDNIEAFAQLVTKMQVEHEQHRDSQKRAFDRIEKCESHYVNLLERIDNVEGKLKIYTASIVGVFIGGSAVWAVLMFFLKNDVISILNAIATASGAK